MAALIGREAELATADAFLHRSSGGPAMLELEGEAGIGKTTLWAEIGGRAAARGFRVLRSRPTAAETALTFAALGDLLESVPDRVFEDLPKGQREAIEVALLRKEPAGDGLHQRLVGVAVRSVLRSLATEGPLIVAIDDLQWLDSASAITLGFALRRLGDVPVGILAARRSGMPSPLDLDALPPATARYRVPLAPLTLAATHHVLKGYLGAALPRAALVRIHEASGGYPLFAIEIARLLQDAPTGSSDSPLPIPSTIRELVRQRIRALPSATREVLLIVAAQHDPTVAGVGAALGRTIAADLAVAERESIASVDGDRIAFSHPLFAAAIYSEAHPEARRDAHARLARTAIDLEARARHRALASLGRDAAAADELAAAARRAAARGAPLAAADLLRLAVRMTPEDEADAIDTRKLALGRVLMLAGDGAEAERVLADAVQTASTRSARARAGLALATLVFELDPGPRSGRIADAALDDARDDLRLTIEAHATLAEVVYDDRRHAAEHAREARRLLGELTDPEPVLETYVLYGYAGAEIRDGKPLPMDVVERALALERRAPPPVVSDRISASLGFWLFLTADDLDGGRRWMEATYAAAVDEGDEGSMPYALSHLPLLEFAAGDWPRAEELARRHLALSTDLGQDSQRLAALFNLGQVLVHQGREAEARPLLAELLRDAEAAGSLWDVTKALGLLGALELARGDADAAVVHLLRASEGRDRIGDDLNRGDDAILVEALVATGQLDRAGKVVDALEQRAWRYGRHSRRATALRSRALLRAALGDLDGAMAALDEALREHDLAPFPFERARTELVLGRVRRRRRERTRAKEAFESALAGFVRLGAAAWAERARGELERVGLRRGSGEALTESERLVAELAATGLTNRDVAAALFLSPKTVEANLARIYRKLDIRSRAELGARVAGQAPGRPPTT